MSLPDFLHFNRDCPICGEPLDLYMQWEYSTLWKAHQNAPDTYTFTPFKLISDKIKKEDTIIICEAYNSIETYFSTPALAEIFKAKEAYFFYLCNEAGFADRGEPATDYEINLYRGCYFRSSVTFKMKQHSKKNWKLEESKEEQASLINKAESFSFKNITEELEKIYMLNLDSVDNLTKLWHYSATPEQRKDENYEPKLFEKEMPLLTVRPKFDLEHREKLLDRFESWIIMS